LLVYRLWNTKALVTGPQVAKEEHGDGCLVLDYHAPKKRPQCDPDELFFVVQQPLTVGTMHATFIFLVGYD